MLDRTIFLTRLRKALRLQDPSIETDVAYQYTDDELWDIVGEAILEHNGAYTSTTIPDKEVHFVLTLCKKEIYFQLATSSAPFYPIKAEGAELRKDVRFDHYMKLVQTMSSEYTTKLAVYGENTQLSRENGNLGEVFISSRHYTTRTIQKSYGAPVNLVIDSKDSTSACLSWDKFNTLDGQFYNYNVYLHTAPIYDKYDDVINTNAVKLEIIENIHRTFYRV
ncbi:fibronectin type III domain-containing protein, partial [bacterium]|nr:fibronectin type III domain-containing protein [bacterium]